MILVNSFVVAEPSKPVRVLRNRRQPRRDDTRAVDVVQRRRARGSLGRVDDEALELVHAERRELRIALVIHGHVSTSREARARGNRAANREDVELRGVHTSAVPGQVVPARVAMVVTGRDFTRVRHVLTPERSIARSDDASLVGRHLQQHTGRASTRSHAAAGRDLVVTRTGQDAEHEVHTHGSQRRIVRSAHGRVRGRDAAGVTRDVEPQRVTRSPGRC